MSNFFVAIAVFLITVIGALFAVPYFVDWNGYRSVFEEEATRLLGREVRVGGAVNLHLLPTPYFRFEKVRIADTSVNLQEPFFRADSLTMKLAVAADAPGRGGGQRDRAAAADAAPGPRRQGRLELAELRPGARQSAYLPANVALTSVKINDGVLAVHGPDGAERTRFEGFNGELSSPALDGPYRLRGTFGKAGAEREMRIATARAEADGTVRFKAILRLDDGRLGLYAGRPPRRPHGQAAHRGRADRPAADRRDVAGAAARQRRGAPKQGAGIETRRGQGRSRLRPAGPPSRPMRPARRSPISRCRSSRTGGRSSSPAS